MPLPRTITYRRVVSLSHPIHPAIPTWPGDPPVQLEPVATYQREGYFLRRLALGEHTATHASAPVAFTPGAPSVDQYRPEALVAPAVVIDARRDSAQDPDWVLSPREIQAWEEAHRPIEPGALVLLHTGWEERWPDPVAFLNADPAGTLHFPGFGVEAARWLLDHRQVAGIGIDTHGVDPGRDQTYGASRAILARGGLILENLAHLHELPPKGAWLVVGLLPLVGGSGSPAAVLALVP